MIIKSRSDVLKFLGARDAAQAERILSDFRPRCNAWMELTDFQISVGGVVGSEEFIKSFRFPFLSDELTDWVLEELPNLVDEAIDKAR